MTVTHQNRPFRMLAQGAGILFLFTAASFCAPSIEVTSQKGATQQQITADGSELPELTAITFTCSYTVPHATLLQSIVASPQPSTALSALVDTATSTVTIAITWTKAVTPEATIPLLHLTIPAAEGACTFTTSTLSTKNGSSLDVPVNIVALRRSHAPRLPQIIQKNSLKKALRVTLNGRTAGTHNRKCSQGCYLATSPAGTSIRLQLR